MDSAQIDTSQLRKYYEIVYSFWAWISINQTH